MLPSAKRRRRELSEIEGESTFGVGGCVCVFLCVCVSVCVEGGESLYVYLCVSVCVCVRKCGGFLRRLHWNLLERRKVPEKGTQAGPVMFPSSETTTRPSPVSHVLCPSSHSSFPTRFPWENHLRPETSLARVAKGQNVKTRGPRSFVTAMSRPSSQKPRPRDKGSQSPRQGWALLIWVPAVLPLPWAHLPRVLCGCRVRLRRGNGT